MMEADCTEEMKSYQVVPAEGTAGGSPAALDASPKVAPLLQPRVYRRRWLMLATFVLVSAVNAFHWIQFSIITNVVMAYYGVDSQSVNWTSLVFMVAYIPLIFPGAWIMDTMVRHSFLHRLRNLWGKQTHHKVVSTSLGFH